jgi:hypothetical protein
LRLGNSLAGKPTELGKTLRAYVVEEEANVDVIGRDARTMARLFGDG